MDSELKQYLEAMEQRIVVSANGTEERIAASAKATEERIAASLRASEQRLALASKALEECLIERVRDTETNLLTEFHKWTSPFELRARSHAAAIKAMDAEIEYLGDRVKKLEDRPSGA
jgi:hypothetical protein